MQQQSGIASPRSRLTGSALLKQGKREKKDGELGLFEDSDESSYSVCEDVFEHQNLVTPSTYWLVQERPEGEDL